MEVYRPIPNELTDPLHAPSPLPEGFTVRDVFERAFELYDTLDTCNRDRESVGRLSKVEN